ncbi:uncharacterized protein [Lolium perenne]|uniref:uncharacterized protein n=1 Tax=Lolium perenne TaxID=4522 RepID=UPI003A9A2AB2
MAAVELHLVRLPNPTRAPTCRCEMKKQALPVLSPTTFALEKFDAAEWISIRTLGFGVANSVSQPSVREASSSGILAAAMASRDGSGNYRGRAPPAGGRGGGRWDGGPNGGRLEQGGPSGTAPSSGGRGGGRWDGGPNGERMQYEHGGPSGTAESTEAGDRQASSTVYGDGVFRAGDVRPNNYGAGNRNPNFRPNNGAGDGRRNFGGNYGSYNNRRFTNSGYGGRYDSNRNAYNNGGLSAREQQLVKQTAETYVPKVNQNAAISPNLGHLQQDQDMEQRSVDVSIVDADIDEQGRGMASDGGSDAGGSVQTKKKGGPTSYRCKKPGHCVNDCSVVLCDCCQKSGHATADCPLLKAPRPRIAMYGLGHPDLSFWELPLSDSVRPCVENTRLGRVKITGGSLSIDEIVTQLRWIVDTDDQYQWDVQMVEQNSFKVNFPSKHDLVRVQRFGRFQVQGTQIHMHFDFWKIDIQPAWTPEDVWVRVYELPPLALDDFLAMWAIGDVFGKTKDLDIVFTRANNVLRILVTCLDPTLIPNTWDLKVKNDFFRLRFEVEGLQRPPPADVVMTDNSKEDDEGAGGNGQSGNASHGDITRSMNISNSENNGGDKSQKSAQKFGKELAKSPTGAAQNLGKNSDGILSPMSMEDKHNENTVSAHFGGAKGCTESARHSDNSQAEFMLQSQRLSHAAHAASTAHAAVTMAGRNSAPGAQTGRHTGHVAPVVQHSAPMAGRIVAPGVPRSAAPAGVAASGLVAPAVLAPTVGRTTPSGPMWPEQGGTQGGVHQPNMHGQAASRGS